MFQNLQSISGIEGAGFGELDLPMVNNNDLTANHEYTIKINGPQGQLNGPSPLTEKLQEGDLRNISTRNAYNCDSTGYDINRELFSDEDIRQAFNVIDINSSGVLTAEELSFFLKCMDQPHSREEVEEMISMVSHDGKRVIMEDFKKIGRGKLPPFAAIKHPESEATVKEEVLQNIRQSILSFLEPDQFNDFKEELEFSREKFEEEKARRQDYRETGPQPLIEDKGGLRMRSAKEIKLKRQQYVSVLMLNVEKAIEALKDLKGETVDIGELAEALSISEAEGKRLFERGRLSVREAVFDTILFSQADSLRKLQLILNNGSRHETLKLEDWVHVLSFMMGVDQQEFIRKRLQNILRHRRVQLAAKFDKYFILQLMNEEYGLFLW